MRPSSRDPISLLGTDYLYTLHLFPHYLLPPLGTRLGLHALLGPVLLGGLVGLLLGPLLLRALVLRTPYALPKNPLAV